MSKKHNSFLFILISILSIGMVFVVLYNGYYQSSSLIPKIFQSNQTLIFVYSLLFGALVFLMGNLIISHISFENSKICKAFDYVLTGKKQKIFYLILLSAGIILLSDRRLRGEYYEFPQRDIPRLPFHLLPPLVAIVLVLGIMALIFITFAETKNKRISDILCFWGYVLSVLFTYFGEIETTLDAGSNFDVHHGCAYIQSIYTVLYYVPFTEKTLGFYGHYGMFYAAIMKLFRLKSSAVFVLIGLTGAISALLCCYIIHNLVKNNLFRFTAAIAIAIPNTMVYSKNYWMAYPHRVFFPVIAMSLLVFWSRHNRYKWLQYISVWFVNTLAFLWNFESGLICVAVTIVGFILRDWQEEYWYDLKECGKYLIYILSSILSLFSAIGIVMAYNVYCSKRTGINIDNDPLLFFFPLGAKSFDASMGYVQKPFFGNHAWIYLLVLFSGTLIFSVSQTTLFQKQKCFNKDSFLLGAIAIAGITEMTFYMAIPAYGKLSIALYPAVFIIAFLCEKLNPFNIDLSIRSTIKEVMMRSVSVLCLLTLLALSSEVLGIGSGNLVRSAFLNYGKSDIHHLASMYNQQIPPDTFSIGSLVDVLNYELHQDSKAHYRELSNSGDDVKERIIEDALRNDTFSVWNMGNGEGGILQGILSEDPGYQLVSESKLGGYDLLLYSRGN